MENKILIGKGNKEVYLNLKYANRHGLIAGATGTGKTVTLKVLAENFVKRGVPVFIADIKGDISGLAKPNEMNEKIAQRVKEMAYDYTPQASPVKFYDVFQEQGTPIRATVSDMGPDLLANLLGLTDVQAGVLHIAFRVADDNQLLLLDLKDLRAMLNYVGEHAAELTTSYGNVSKASIGAILRAILTLEEAGGNLFFGEPMFNIEDFFPKADQPAWINILDAVKLYQQPLLYATFLLWLLSELFENLPEVGDQDKPKIVFFFDEAHLIFENTPKALKDTIERVVKLIRSKGVGIYFITQNPADIPDSILAQLGNRIQHALRAYTPKEIKAIKAAADSFRANPEFDTTEVITLLKTGEALVSCLDDEGIPSIVEKATICPPQCSFDPISNLQRQQLINADPLNQKYTQTIDNRSAYEVLTEALQKEQEATVQTKNQATPKKNDPNSISTITKRAAQTASGTLTREFTKSMIGSVTGNYHSRKSPVEKAINSAVSSVSTSVGRQLIRGIFGILSKK